MCNHSNICGVWCAAISRDANGEVFIEHDKVWSDSHCNKCLAYRLKEIENELEEIRNEMGELKSERVRYKAEEKLSTLTIRKKAGEDCSCVCEDFYGVNCCECQQGL